jgi:anti-sigma factor RsiW
MHCREAQALLDAYVDRELDVVQDLAIAAHLQTCQRCTLQHDALLALRAALHTGGAYFVPPAHVHRRIRRTLRYTGSGKRWRSSWVGLAAGIIGALALGGVLLWQHTPAVPSEPLAREVVANHVRSLMVDHLTDLASSDSHTLKPWFSNKLDFAPPVIDLTAQGFSLVGGRLEYLHERPAAAIVYQRRRHLINVLITPASASLRGTAPPMLQQGYHLWHWTTAGMAYWVVSDLNRQELGDFVQLLQARSEP